MIGQSTAKTDSVRNVGGRFTAYMKKKNQKQLKDMAKELEKYKDSVFFLNKLGGLVKVKINSLDDYNHGLNGCELHHFIPYSSYVNNIEWYEARGIKQKLILVSKVLHEHIHNQGIRQLTDTEFEKKYKISRWKLLFNRKYSNY